MVQAKGGSKISSLVCIKDSVRKILSEIPPDVILLAAAKTRTLEEVKAVIEAGITHIGYNYVQESLPIIENIRDRAQWHMIGHIQTNKAKIIAENFNFVETVDSWRLAQVLEKHCKRINKIMPVLIELNSGRESSKTGVLPENLMDLIYKMKDLKYLHVEGLMTMGPRFGDPEESRPYFVLTRSKFEMIASLNFPNIEMKFLSMGMSNSYKIAIQEGANIVRIGTRLFGLRPKQDKET